MPFIEDMVANFFRSLGELGETGTMTEADRNRLGRMLGETGTMTEADTNRLGRMVGETGMMTEADRNRLGRRAVRAPLGRDIFARAERGLGPRGLEQSLDLVYDPGSYSARAGAHTRIPWAMEPTSSFRVGADVPDVPFIGGELGGVARGQFGSGFNEGQLQYRKSLGELDRDLGRFLRKKRTQQRIARGQGQTDQGQILNQLAAAIFGQ